MRTTALALLLLTLGVVPQAVESEYPFSDSVERSFVLGGKVSLDLSAGDYLLRRGDDKRIRVVWRTRTREQMKDAKVRVDAHGSEAEILTDGSGNGFRAEIELPERTDLYLRMTAGDLSIAGIQGNKDVRLRAGDLDIEVGDPEQYGHVEASVTAGDISAQPFGHSTGGLFRSFSHDGRGRFELRVRLWAGDLRLLPSSEARR